MSMTMPGMDMGAMDGMDMGGMDHSQHAQHGSAAGGGATPMPGAPGM